MWDPPRLGIERVFLALEGGLNHCATREVPDPKPLNRENSGQVPWGCGKTGKKVQVGGIRRGGVIPWPPAETFVPVAAFFLALIVSLESFHYPGGAVLL